MEETHKNISYMVQFADIHEYVKPREQIIKDYISKYDEARRTYPQEKMRILGKKTDVDDEPVYRNLADLVLRMKYKTGK